MSQISSMFRIFFAAGMLALFAVPASAAPSKTYSLNMQPASVPVGGGYLTATITNVTPSGGNSAINSFIIGKPASATIGNPASDPAHPITSSDPLAVFTFDAGGNLKVNNITGLLPKNQQGSHTITVTFWLKPDACTNGQINWEAQQSPPQLSPLVNAYTGNAWNGDPFLWDGVTSAALNQTTNISCGSVTVNKVYSGAAPTNPAVTVNLTCASGTISQTPLQAAPGAPAVFTVSGYSGTPSCTATESQVPAGYSSSGTCSANVNGSCTITNTLNSGTVTVNKAYSGTAPANPAVAMSLTCASGTVSQTPLQAAPGNPAVFTVTGYSGSPTCTATESVPPGYTGSGNPAGTCTAGVGGNCTITNTLNSANFTVNKLYSPAGSTTAVSMSLSCTSGTVSQTPLNAAPGNPAIFTVTGYAGNPTCTATESVPPGYTASNGGTCATSLSGGSCTITNSLNSGLVTVNKLYSPVGPTTAVSMSLTCSNGTVSQTPLNAAPGNPAVFTVTGYSGSPTCTATESVPPGYTGSGNPAGTCTASVGGNCTITNTRNDGTVTVNKAYSGTAPANPAVTMSLACIGGGSVTEASLQASPTTSAVFHVT